MTGVSWTKRAAIWMGIGINPASITLGGGLASLLPTRTLLLAISVGLTLLATLLILQGISGRRRRQAFGQRALVTFGSGIGANSLNLFMAAGMIGWGAFQIGIAGTSLAALLGLPVWLGVLVLAIAIFVLSELGINRWHALLWLTTLSALALAISSLIITDARPAIVEAGVTYDANQFFWVVGTVVAYAILFALRCVDFTWDLAKDSDVLKDTICFVATFLTALFVGILLFQTTGDWNLADILGRYRSAALGQLFLIVAVASPAFSGLHSSTLALQSLTPLSRRRAALIICIIMFGMGAARFDRQLLPFLDWVGTLLPPALIVMLVVAWTRGPFSTRAALLAWFAGALAAMFIKLQGQFIPMPVGAATSLIVLTFFWLRQLRFAEPAG